VKKRIGSAYPTGTIEELEVKGRDLVGGVPKTVVLNSEEIREALSDAVNSIIEVVRVSLERTPPELAADIVDRGLMLSGGGAQLRMLDVLLREETGLPVLICDDPEGAVARGSGAALDNLDLLSSITVQ
jgi:rod shape-determining protein MreB